MATVRPYGFPELGVIMGRSVWHLDLPKADIVCCRDDGVEPKRRRQLFEGLMTVDVPLCDYVPSIDIFGLH